MEINKKDKIAVSSCLLGENCKYNGGNNYTKDIELLKEKYDLIPICPEVFGGLPTPRVPSERINDKVMNKDGIDVTDNYNMGAKLALDILLKNNIKIAILKLKSPSCGKDYIYDGTFTHNLVNRNGVTVDLFLKNGIKIYTEDNFLDLLK